MLPFALIAAAAGFAGRVIQGISASNQVKEAGKQAELQAKGQARGYIRQAEYTAKDILRQGEVQAKNYLTQAALHERQAALARIKGSYDAARMTEVGRRVVGSQVASFASSGIAITGTIADVVRSTGDNAAMDIAASRLSTRIGWENEMISRRINRKNARDAIKYSEEAAIDALKFGKKAAEDTLKFGATAAASASRAAPLAFVSPVVQGVGEFASSSGIFDRG